MKKLLITLLLSLTVHTAVIAEESKVTGVVQMPDNKGCIVFLTDGQMLVEYTPFGAIITNKNITYCYYNETGETYIEIDGRDAGSTTNEPGLIDKFKNFEDL